MIKGKIFEKCKQYFEEYLFGFDQNHLKTSFLTGKIHLSNVNIRPDKVNELFAKKNLPIALKAGLITELSVKVNLFQLFSESLKIVVEDVLFIVGPNISHISQDQDFENDINSPYDDQNQMQNILKMHHKVYEQRKQEKKIEKAKKKDENKAKLEKAKTKAKKKEIKEPPMKIITNLLGGLKLEIKRVHFRYEDDYFNHHKPFAFGVMIESIIMDNSDTDWLFESLMSMNFTRNQPSNPKTTNKELNIKNLKVYWNSMSEMFVPTSLWQQTRNLQFQIFEAMDANFLKEIMTDAFSDKQALPYNYLIQPFNIYTQINLNPSQGANDAYKYQINTLISQINVNVIPHLVRDILKFQQFLEMFSYAKDLKKYRPLIKIQTFIEQQAYTPQQKKKRHAVIRDWFQLVLWYVRLRKISKGFTPHNLLEVESQYQNQNLQNALMKVKRANLMAYEHYQGSSDEDDFTDPSKINSARTEDLDAQAQYEKQQFDIRNTNTLRDMLTGFKFALRLEGVKLKVFTKKNIIKAHQNLPRLELSLDMLTVAASIQGHNLIAKVLLKEVMLLDYFKRETLKTFSRQTNNISRQNPNMQRDTSYSRSQAQLENAQPKGTLAGMIGKAFSGSNAYNTPDKNGGRTLTDIIYGSGPSQDRTNLNSRQVPYDFFALDLPDPSMAHNKTRETLTISDILNNTNPSSRPTSVQQYGGVPQSRQTNRNNQSILNQNYQQDAYQMTSPNRGSKIVKAQKFQQSPTKGQERTSVMNNQYLNQRSENFVDDQLDSVDKRCFFLMCGKAPNIDPFLTVDISCNIFDEPGLKKKVNLNVCIDQIIIEYCNDILKSLTDLGMQYKLAFNFSDMKTAKGPSKKNKKRGLQTSVQYYASLYVLKKLLFKRALNVKEEAILNYQKQWYIQKEKSKSKNDVMKESREKQINTILKIKDLDKKLSDVNFEVGVVLKNVNVGITGDRDDPFVSNQTLLEFGIENQGVYLNKQDFKCKVSVFGISVTTLNSFEMLFIFANNMKKVVATYGENIAVLTSVTAYKDFIKNIKKSLELANKNRLLEEQQELMRKASQPQIVIIGNDSNRGNGRFNQHERQPSLGNKKQIQFSNDIHRDNQNVNLRQPQVQVNNNYANYEPKQNFQAERNIINKKPNFEGQNQAMPNSQARMGSNQITLKNQNTIQSDKQIIKQNPQILAQDYHPRNQSNNAFVNRQQTGYNGKFQMNQSSEEESDQDNQNNFQQLNQQNNYQQNSQKDRSNNSRDVQFQQNQNYQQQTSNFTRGGPQQPQYQQQQQQQQSPSNKFKNNSQGSSQKNSQQFSNHQLNANNFNGGQNSGRRVNNNVQVYEQQRFQQQQQQFQQEQESDDQSQQSSSNNDGSMGYGQQDSFTQNMGMGGHNANGGMRMRGQVQGTSNAAEFNIPPRKR